MKHLFLLLSIFLASNVHAQVDPSDLTINPYQADTGFVVTTYSNYDPWQLPVGRRFPHVQTCPVEKRKYKLPELVDGEIKFVELVLNLGYNGDSYCIYSTVEYDENQMPYLTGKVDISFDYYTDPEYVDPTPRVYRINSGWAINSIYVPYIQKEKVFSRIERDINRDNVSGSIYDLKLFETHKDGLTRVPGGWISNVSFIPFEPYRDAKKIADTGK